MLKDVVTARLKELMLKGRLYNLHKGQILQRSDDRQVVNLVRSGYIKRYSITNDGSIAIQSIYGKDDFFPLTLVFATLFDQKIYEGPETIYYEAMVDSEVYTVDNVELDEAVAADSDLYRSLLFESGKRLKSNIQRLENISLKSSNKRLAHQLLYFGRQFGNKKTSGIYIDIPLTHQDLADVLSLTRETVSANMAELREQKLVRTRKYIIIPDLDKLQEFAYS